MTVLSALLLIGLALGGSMFYVLVFPAKPKPIVCPSPTATCVNIPFGVSVSGSLNFQLSNVTIKPGDFVQRQNLDDSPHTATATPVPAGATKFDSEDVECGNICLLQHAIPGAVEYHC